MMQIIYEDNDILVINKPAGQVVHSDKNNPDGTLVDDLIEYYPAIKNAVIDPSDPISRERAGIVHRLDKDTSGLLVVAKNRESLIKLQKSFQENKVKKCYTTLLYGRLNTKETVETKITLSKRSDKAMMISRNNQGRMAISIFKPIKYYRFDNTDLTLAEVEIQTGRTHQIRIHAASIQHPVIGDQMYRSKPSKRLSKSLNLSRQFLHASKLSFPHPRTMKVMNFESMLTDDLERLLFQMTNSEF